MTENDGRGLDISRGTASEPEWLFRLGQRPSLKNVHLEVQQGLRLFKECLDLVGIPFEQEDRFLQTEGVFLKRPCYSTQSRRVCDVVGHDIEHFRALLFLRSCLL